MLKTELIQRTASQNPDLYQRDIVKIVGYGSGANLDWLVNEARIAPDIPVIDK